MVLTAHICISATTHDKL